MAQHSRTAGFLAAALVVVLPWLVTPARAYAQVEEVKLTVEGMTCNLCAAGLDRALRRVEGVAGVQVVLASQEATLRLKAASLVAPAQLRKAVERAGQRLRVVELRLRGTLQRDGERYQLRPAGPGQVFSVRDDVKLETLTGRNVRVRGRVVSSDAAAIELELVDIAPL